MVPLAPKASPTPGLMNTLLCSAAFRDWSSEQVAEERKNIQYYRGIRIPRQGHKYIPGPTNVQDEPPIVGIGSMVCMIAKKNSLWRTWVACETPSVRHENTYLEHFGVVLGWQEELFLPRVALLRAADLLIGHCHIYIHVYIIDTTCVYTYMYI